MLSLKFLKFASISYMCIKVIALELANAWDGKTARLQTEQQRVLQFTVGMVPPPDCATRLRKTPTRRSNLERKNKFLKVQQKTDFVKAFI